MTYKQILVPVITLEEDQGALSTAASLGRQFEASAAALVLAVHLASQYAEEAQPLSAVLEDIGAGSRSQAAREHARIAAWIEAKAHDIALHGLTIERAVDQNRVAEFARVADLIVVARAAKHAFARQLLLEDVLFRSGRPLLIMPADRDAERFDNILIAWNARPESVRAVSGAMPLLKSARNVTITTIDATPAPGGHCAHPGLDLSAYLALHGVSATVRNADGLGRTHAEALQDEALAINADLIVLGAYGHSRAREFVFGGVTRDLLAGSSTALLMAH